MSESQHSRQARKTRGAILSAFHDLVLERRYSAIRVADIIHRANVGRSTFYDHFGDKDDLLRQSMTGILSVLADTINDNYDTKRLQMILDHFRENLPLVRGMLNGESCPEVVRVLSGLIEERMVARRKASGLTTGIPVELAATQVAEALLGLVRAWLNRGVSCSSATVAGSMRCAAVALARVLSP
jgi:AcrR family transcriptional regulator